MKFLDKFGLALFSLLILILSIILCLMGLNIVQPTIFGILITKALQYQTATYILIGVSIFLILLSIRCLFFSNYGESEDESEEGILMQNSDGKLLITRDSLESMTEGVIKEFASIESSQTKVKITKEKDVLIQIIIDVRKGTVIKETTSKLQTRVKKAVKEATDLDIKQVDIKVRNVESENEEINETKTKNSRAKEEK